MKPQLPNAVNLDPNRAAESDTTALMVFRPIRSQNDIITYDLEGEVGECDVNLSKIHRIRVICFV